MAYEIRELDCNLFTNDRKNESWHADFNGKILVDGKNYYVNLMDKREDPQSKVSFRLQLREVGAPKQAPRSSGFESDDLGL